MQRYQFRTGKTCANVFIYCPLKKMLKCGSRLETIKMSKKQHVLCCLNSVQLVHSHLDKVWNLSPAGRAKANVKSTP